MSRKIPVIITAVAIIIVLIVFLSNIYVEFDDAIINKQHESVWSGPIGVTQYEHRLGESVFLQIRDLKPNENGNIYIYTPQGILFKTIPYDGSLKANFNQYFTPDTSVILQICTPEDLVGKWRIIFEDGSYSPLEFEFTTEYIRSGEVNIQVEC